MTIQQIYDLALEMGMQTDPRGLEKVKKLLAKIKKEFEELPEKKKKNFDKESLKNPYSDSRILFGDPKKEVKTIMAGIDAGPSEILLADRLNEKGRKIDLVISHHPSSHALASLHDVMDVQVHMFADAGVPENVAYALLQERKSLVKRRFGPLNHTQTVDAARLLDIPLMVLHTMWDNLYNKYIIDYLAKKKFETAGEVLNYIKEIPEFVEAEKMKNAPVLVSGGENNPVGKIVAMGTGGTTPSKELYIELAKAGVGTLVEMHISEEGLQELKKLHMNVIDTGHMAADSIGGNLFLDALEKKGIQIIPNAGLSRVKRI